MSRRRRVPAAVREGRKLCAFEFDPLWKPAASIARRPLTALERADLQAAAKLTAFAWLAAQLGLQRLSSFDDIADLELLRRAYQLIWNATINDVRAWADAREAAVLA